MGGPERHLEIKAVVLLACLKHTKLGSEVLESVTKAGSHHGLSPKVWDHLLLRSITAQVWREGAIFV